MHTIFSSPSSFNSFLYSQPVELTGKRLLVRPLQRLWSQLRSYCDAEVILCSRHKTSQQHVLVRWFWSLEQILTENTDLIFYGFIFSD